MSSSQKEAAFLCASIVAEAGERGHDKFVTGSEIFRS